MLKKAILLISVIGLATFVISMYPISLGVCEEINRRCWRTLSNLQEFLGIFPAVFLFSLITYKMQEEVFRAWWGVAKWFVPVIIVVTFLFNMPGTSGLGMSGAYADTFSILILGLLYAIFILTSIVKILLAYRRSRQ